MKSAHISPLFWFYFWLLMLNVLCIIIIKKCFVCHYISFFLFLLQMLTNIRYKCFMHYYN